MRSELEKMSKNQMAKNTSKTMAQSSLLSTSPPFLSSCDKPLSVPVSSHHRHDPESQARASRRPDLSHVPVDRYLGMGQRIDVSLHHLLCNGSTSQIQRIIGRWVATQTFVSPLYHLFHMSASFSFPAFPLPQGLSQMPHPVLGVSWPVDHQVQCAWLAVGHFCVRESFHLAS